MESVSHYPATEPQLIRGQTVGSLLRQAAERAPDIRALVEGSGDHSPRVWTYSDLLDEAEQAARALLGRFAPGERLAVWANNVPEWVVLEMAAALAGLTLVTVNPALRPSEVRHVLGQSRSAGVFLLAEYRGNPMLESLDSVRRELAELREVVLFRDWPAFLASGAATQALPSVAPGDPAQIQYTSGTTGVPKGAVLHHDGIVNNAQLSYARLFGLQPGEVSVNAMPLFHTAGCVLATLSCIASLGTHVLMPRFDPGLQLRLIESERSVLCGGVPTMLSAMLDHPHFPATDLSSVRFGYSGGDLVPPQLVDRWERTTGKAMLIIYAQTEASPGIAMTRPDDTPDDRRTTVGRPLPGVEVKIDDGANGAPAPIGAVGELCTRGHHVMTGYFDEPDQTAAAIDTDGWLHTGDLARMDGRGYVRIEGRLKDMIIRGGENIYPREVEQTLLTHPTVAAAAVVGAPDELWGEQVASFVVPAAGAAPDETELFDHVRQRLAPHKTPNIWRFVDALPLTGSGKVQKHVLRNCLQPKPSDVGRGPQAVEAVEI